MVPCSTELDVAATPAIGSPDGIARCTPGERTGDMLDTSEHSLEGSLFRNALAQGADRGDRLNMTPAGDPNRHLNILYIYTKILLRPYRSFGGLGGLGAELAAT